MAVVEEQDGWRWSVSGAEAVITTRAHGNIGIHVGDDPVRVAAARERAAGLLDLTTEDIAGVSQVHGADVWLDLRLRAQLPTEVRWSSSEQPAIEADALVTTRPGVALAVGVADCMPIALVLGDAIAAVHAGWRSLEAGVIEATAATLRRAAGSSAAVVGAGPRALIGPAICARCMEVGEEVAARFDAAVIRRPTGAPRPFLNARADATRRLAELGFEVEHVPACTVEDPRLFSHRGDGGGTSGRQALLVRRAAPVPPGA